ncbi:MAG: hypothetical protein ACOCP8_03750 [archaeon]
MDYNLKSQVNVLFFSFDSYYECNTNKVHERKFVDWIYEQLKDFKINYIHLSGNQSEYSKQDVYDVVKENLDDKKYIFVIFANSVLIKKESILNSLDYFRLKDSEISKLEKAFIIKTEYVKRNDKIYNPKTLEFETNLFKPITNLYQLDQAKKKLNFRIVQKNIKKGVKINTDDLDKIQIGPEVNIAKDVKISGNVTIKGNSYIEEEVEIFGNTTIENSYILKNAVIDSSLIKDSIIQADAQIGVNTTIINKSIIEERAKILGYNYLNKAKIKQDSVIESFKHLGKKD